MSAEDGMFFTNYNFRSCCKHDLGHNSDRYSLAANFKAKEIAAFEFSGRTSGSILVGG